MNMTIRRQNAVAAAFVFLFFIHQQPEINQLQPTSSWTFYLTKWYGFFPLRSIEMYFCSELLLLLLLNAQSKRLSSYEIVR